jgi:hypothetical protein
MSGADRSWIAAGAGLADPFKCRSEIALGSRRGADELSDLLIAFAIARAHRQLKLSFRRST